MKFLIQVLVTVFVCFVLQYFLPWWTMSIGAFVIGYACRNKGFVSFFAGFLGAGILWLGTAYYIDTTTHSILTSKINRLLPLNAMLLTSLVGGLVGGFAALTGAMLRRPSKS